MYSRLDSKIELFHNQLTKYQGIYSLRYFLNTFGIHVIGANIEVPTTVLDFPSLARFREEVKKGYDYVGIGSIVPNFNKVKRMVEDVRELSPRSKIVLGGFCATIPGLRKMVDVDHVCIGDGITFMRELLGLPPEFTFRHPDVYVQPRELMGVPIFGKHYPAIVVGLGCSYGCDFCTPSHFFGRRHIRFLKTGEEIFKEMLRLEKKYHSTNMTFVGDDNFFLDLKRAEELRKLVMASGKVFKVLLFGSADKVAEFGPERLAEMGVSVLWIGRESKFGDYRKNKTLDLVELSRTLRSYGIKTIISSILLMDNHTKENIMEDVSEHLSCEPVFSQFSFYSPAPGTPLWERMEEEGRLLRTIPWEDCHAFKQPWFIHPEFGLLEAEKVQEAAYLRDFHELGPSIFRFIRADYEGWRRYRGSSEPYHRVLAADFAKLMGPNKILLLAMERLVPTESMREMIRELRQRIEADFGPSSFPHRLAATGLVLTGRSREFYTRHFGDTLQPPTRVVGYNS
jgi:hypothetical protein